MIEPSPVFDRHYRHYLSLLAALDLEKAGTAAGAVSGSRGEVEILYFNTRYQVSGRAISGPEGHKPGYDTCTILSRYLIMAGQRRGKTPEPSGWTGFRDLKDTGPLTVYFRDNVEGAIAGMLTGRLPGAGKALTPLLGRNPDLDAAYDLALEFRALPRIPVLLLFNDAAEGFPSSCSLLFRPDAATHLDAECLAMLGARLAVLVRRCLGPGQGDIP